MHQAELKCATEHYVSGRGTVDVLIMFSLAWFSISIQLAYSHIAC